MIRRRPPVLQVAVFAGGTPVTVAAVALRRNPAGGEFDTGLLELTAEQESAPIHQIDPLLPAAVTVAFLVRTATVTERTATTNPFTIPSQEQ